MTAELDILGVLARIRLDVAHDVPGALEREARLAQNIAKLSALAFRAGAMVRRVSPYLATDIEHATWNITHEEQQ